MGVEGGTEIGRVEEALRGGLPLGSVTRGWPKAMARLPCMVIREVENRPADYRDDAPYLLEVVMELHIFAERSQEKQALCNGAEQVMAGLGYRRLGARDGEEKELRTKILRYGRTALAKEAWA